jgi:tRNA(adenine34) deaminase
MITHEKFMQLALEEAQKALELDETPIGAVLVFEERIIATGHNKRNTLGNALAHAEILAINAGCQAIGDWRLEECTLYVTLEPCPMCAGAIVQARIPRVVFGAESPKAGCAGSVLNLLQVEALNHRCEVVKGICEKESAALLKDYFKKMRQKGEKKS